MFLSLLSLLLTLFAANSVSQTPPPPARACKLPAHDHITGCVLCGLYTINGYCTCKIIDPCTNATTGADTMEFSGSCVVPVYCGAATPQEAAALAVKNQAKYAYWLKSTNLPAAMDEPMVKLAVEKVQKNLLRADVGACSWSTHTLVMRNEANPDDPIWAEFKDVGNAHVIYVYLESSKEKKGDYWTLTMFPKNWVLDKPNGEKLHGDY